MNSNNLKSTDKCHQCGKKIGIVKYNCKCGNCFCSIHRTIESHNCKYDYKNEHQKILENNNPKVDVEKCIKI